MNGTIGNTEQDERGLLPYPVIIAVTKGDPDAMAVVMRFCPKHRGNWK